MIAASPPVHSGSSGRCRASCVNATGRSGMVKVVAPLAGWEVGVQAGSQPARNSYLPKPINKTPKELYPWAPEVNELEICS